LYTVVKLLRGRCSNNPIWPQTNDNRSGARWAFHYNRCKKTIIIISNEKKKMFAFLYCD
jgi:hypothetical protein